MARQAREGVGRRREQDGKGELVWVRTTLASIHISVRLTSHLVSGSKFLKWAPAKKPPTLHLETSETRVEMENNQKINRKLSCIQCSRLNFLLRTTPRMKVLLQHLIKAECHPQHIQRWDPFVWGLPTAPLAFLFTTGSKISHKTGCTKKQIYTKYSD